VTVIGVCAPEEGRGELMRNCTKLAAGIW